MERHISLHRGDDRLGERQNIHGVLVDPGE
jgi:hypothetical protein